MNCPYCDRVINAWTGLQELQKFQKHLGKCRKNPANFPLPLRGGRRLISPSCPTMNDALILRHESGQ
jgi:hypothetical protein